jgi:fatty acid CoA ligase FadD32
LTTTDSAEGVRKFFHHRPAKQRPRVIAVDAIPDEVAQTWQQRPTDQDTIAYLQYTSGSTRAPAGVKITQLAVATNLLQLITALQVEEGQRGVMWLPLFHDMGLITAMVPSVVGRSITIMSPAAFVRRPIRWMR